MLEYKNKKDVVGRDIQLDKIKSAEIFNTGKKNFCKKIIKLTK